ncbi:hypothetical protein B5G38_06090 [Gemmiger sp. An87]|nr:hypothetical protein B5G38_06090 [Gemmiger sp. An87]
MIKQKNVVKNTGMLLALNIAKMFFPFVTLPYLTRVLSVDTYGTVAYVKTVMSYMQILVDFGFVLSATKDVIQAKHNKDELEHVIGDTIVGKMLLGIGALLVLLVLIAALPILRNNALYTLLSYVVVFESIFLLEFLFRGLEIMHVITIRFIVMKTLSTLLTFALVKSDADLLLIPLFDILSSLVAVLMAVYEVWKLGLRPKFTGIQKAVRTIRQSMVYFFSNAASTSFNALSTLIIGVQISQAQVAYWSVCMQVINAIQACYTPIADGVYPEMIKSRNLALIRKIVKIFLPLVAVGCCLAYVFAGLGMYILGGEEYLVAVPVFRTLIPVLFFGFLSVMFGWPVLGSIGKEREATFSTVCSVVLHIALLVLLIVTDTFTLINIAIVRSVTEMVFFGIRFFFFRKYRNLFETKNAGVTN